MQQAEKNIPVSPIPKLVLMQIEPMKLREMKLDLSRNNYQISPDY